MDGLNQLYFEMNLKNLFYGCESKFIKNTGRFEQNAND